MKSSSARSRNNQLLIGYARDEDIKALFELLGMIAKASPPVAPKQIQEIEKFITSQVPSNSRDYAISCFRNGKEITIVKGAITNRAFQLYGYQGEGSVERWLEPVQVLDILLRVALVDGDYAEDEDYIVDCVRATLGVHNRAYWTLRDTLAERIGVWVRRAGKSFADNSHERFHTSTHEDSNSRNSRKPNSLSRSEACTILEVSEDADTQEIKSAHRGLVKRYHPDLLSGTISDKDLEDAVKRFCEIQEAYEILLGN